LLLLAQAPAGFGIRWGTLFVTFGLIVLVMIAIRFVGLLAARALPDEPPATRGSLGAPVLVGSAASTAIPPRPLILPGTPIEGLTPCALANLERRTVVLIAAAVAAVEGPRARILDIRRVQGGNISSQQAWSMEGRREIYLSHRIR
jgi:hypothetical protein